MEIMGIQWTSKKATQILHFEELYSRTTHWVKSVTTSSGNKSRCRTPGLNWHLEIPVKIYFWCNFINSKKLPDPVENVSSEENQNKGGVFEFDVDAEARLYETIFENFKKRNNFDPFGQS